MKITYCGYDFFHACLQELLEEDVEVDRVFTMPCDNQYNYNQYIYHLCKKYNIPISAERINTKTIEQLEADGCRILITAAYSYKIPSLDSTSIRGINIHPSLLPVGRGVWPLPWPILNKQQRSGVTIHKLEEEYDAGDILLQQSFSLFPNERLESLSVKAQLLAKSMLMEVMGDFDRFWENATAQTGESSHWNYPTRSQRALDWSKNVDELDRTCRAFGKFGCFARFNEQDWVVYGLIAWEQMHSFPIGKVIHQTNTEMVVAAKNGLVSLLYFEPDKGSR